MNLYNASNLLVWLAVLMPSLLWSEVRIHVNSQIDLSFEEQDGEGWASAYQHLQDALTHADEFVSDGKRVDVWVAKGVYYPDDGELVSDGDVAESFQLRGDVRLYGGFTGIESVLEERDVRENPTILSGDTGHDDHYSSVKDVIASADDLRGQNSAHVTVGTIAEGEVSELNGFIVTGGSADGTNGGGILIQGGAPIIQQCQFTGNRATGEGGAVYCLRANPRFLECVFSNNEAGNGGAISNFYSSPEFTNCLIYGNVAMTSGGAIFNTWRSAPKFYHCTITGNTAGESGGGIYSNSREAAVFANSIIWDNYADGDRNMSHEALESLTFHHSIVDDRTMAEAEGSSNLYKDPLFVVPYRAIGSSSSNLSVNLRLASNSPAIGAGSVLMQNDEDEVVTVTCRIDLLGRQRDLVGVDVGAYASESRLPKVMNPPEPLAFPWQSSDRMGVIDLKTVFNGKIVRYGLVSNSLFDTISVRVNEKTGFVDIYDFVSGSHDFGSLTFEAQDEDGGVNYVGVECAVECAPQLFSLVEKGRSEKQPSMTFFVRMPRNWNPAAPSTRQIRGVLAFCTWDRTSEKVERNLSGPYTKFRHLGEFADEHGLAIVSWTTKTLHNRQKSYFELTKKEQKASDELFEDAVSTWSRGYRRLARKYALPERDLLLFGMSGGAQYAHRLAMRVPQYFSAVHIHVNSSYDKPTRDGKKLLWLVTTGELEQGYPASKEFYRTCIEQEYRMIFKAGENLGHAGRDDIYQLGHAFFEYALKFIHNPIDPTAQKAAVDQFYLMRYPVYIGDYFNHQVYPIEKRKFVKRERMVALPTRALAEAWGPVVE